MRRKLRLTFFRAFPLLVLALGLVGCADQTAAPETDLPIDVAVFVPPPPPLQPPEPALAAHFDCDGTILHQSINSKTESPLQFDFDVRSDGVVRGTVTNIGPPLSLPSGRLAGRFSPRFDTDNRLVGGHMVVTWPHAKSDPLVAFRVMRETFIRAGQSIDGVGKVIRRTSAHTYLSAQITFDANSHAALTGFKRAAFVNATCTPAPDFPARRAETR